MSLLAKDIEDLFVCLSLDELLRRESGEEDVNRGGSPPLRRARLLGVRGAVGLSDVREEEGMSPLT